MTQICPKCGKEMVEIGFIIGFVLAVYPPKPNLLYACDACKVIKSTIEQDKYARQFGGRNLKEYEFL
jgi:predicted amidophosphoribosyltransferase